MTDNVTLIYRKYLTYPSNSPTIGNVERKPTETSQMIKPNRIEKVTSNEQNVSQREVSYDVYVNGVYMVTFSDVIEAMDYLASI